MIGPAPDYESESSMASSSKTGEVLHQSKAMLRRFLEYTDPSLLSDDGSALQLDTPITEWDVLYSTPPPTKSSKDVISPSIIVSSHPSPDKNLFSVQSVVPGIDARQFWCLMANSTNRHLWDSTVEISNVQWWIADQIHHDYSIEENKRDDYERIARRLSARVELLRFGSIMFVANKRDMVLLSIDTQLPSSDGRLRLLSTSTSIDDPRIPPKKGYNRFQLHTGGFLVEDLGNTAGNGVSKDSVGIRVTQLSDLGEMASWVPASIIKMVASTMVPRSVNAIAKVASKMQVPEALQRESAGYAGEGDADQDKEKLSDVGGTWQKRRPLPPMWTKTDSSWDESSSSQDMSRCDSLELTSESSASSSMPHTPSLEEDATHTTHRLSKIGSEGFTLQDLSLPLSSQNNPLSPTLQQQEEGSMSEYSYSMATSSPRSRITFGLDSGTETIPGSPRSSMRGSEDPVEELIDDLDVTLRRSGNEEEGMRSGPSEGDEGEEEEPLGKSDSMEYEDEEVPGLLFSDVDMQNCSQLLSRHTRTFSRMSQAQKHTHKRISTMLVNGSDAIAMAIAPGARDSMASVARIMDANIIGLQEELDQEEAASDSQAEQLFRRRLGSSTSTIAPPTMTTAYVGGEMDTRSGIVSSHASRSSAGSTTLCDERSSTSNHPVRIASSASWTSSITEAPYTLALSILHLATWAASRPLSCPSPPAVVEEEEGSGDEERAGSAETSKPTMSALSVTRLAYSQRNQLRRKTRERPRSHYRVDDTKLHPFPHHINNENLPPVGIASGVPAKFMDCGPAKAPLQEPLKQGGGWWGPYW